MTIDHAVSRYAQDAPVVPLDDGKDLAGVLSRISPSPHVSPAAVSSAAVSVVAVWNT